MEAKKLSLEIVAALDELGKRRKAAPIIEARMYKTDRDRDENLDASIQRDRALARISALEAALASERRVRKLLVEAFKHELPEQDPLEAEVSCDWCSAFVSFDEIPSSHDRDCRWELGRAALAAAAELEG